jgi:hypothetical protein
MAVCPTTSRRSGILRPGRERVAAAEDCGEHAEGRGE